MQDFQKGLKTFYDGADFNATRTAGLTGGLWALHAKDGAAAPYAVYSYPDGGLREHWIGSKDGYERVLVDFALFVDDFQLDSALAIRDAFVAAMDGATFTFTGGRVVYALRMRTGTPLRDPDEGYMLVISYEFVLDI